MPILQPSNLHDELFYTAKTASIYHIAPDNIFISYYTSVSAEALFSFYVLLPGTLLTIYD